MEIFKNKIPSSILDEDSYLFHGTSNIFENKLDCGYTMGNQNVRFQFIDDIISLYKEIKWLGKHGGGFAVLSTFSATDRNEKGKYFFLGETPQRCCLYASKDFAGGELNRSIYHSINDLIEYVKNEELRENHKKQMERDFPFTGEQYDVNLKVLEHEVNKYSQLHSEISNLINAYKYGVVYCYRIEKEDYPSLLHRDTMGIAVKSLIPSDRLKAKLILDNPEEIYYKNLTSQLNTERYVLWKFRIKNQYHESTYKQN